MASKLCNSGHDNLWPEGLQVRFSPERQEMADKEETVGREGRGGGGGVGRIRRDGGKQMLIHVPVTPTMVGAKRYCNVSYRYDCFTQGVTEATKLLQSLKLVPTLLDQLRIIALPTTSGILGNSSQCF